MDPLPPRSILASSFSEQAARHLQQAFFGMQGSVEHAQSAKYVAMYEQSTSG